MEVVMSNHIRRILVIAACIGLVLCCACSQGEKKARVGYVQITQDAVLNAAKKGVFAALKDSGFVDGQNIQVLDNNAQGDLSLIPTILQSLQSQGVDLIITNSTPCMVAAAQSIATIPVVFTVAFSPEQVGMKATPPNLHGIYDPLDAKRFVSMMVECLPMLRRVGLPYNNSEPNAEYSAKVFSQEFESRGIAVIRATVNSPNDLMMVGQSLTSQRIDALISAADNTVYMGLNALARVAGDSKVPLFVTDPEQAKKGASVGMGVNYERWGYLSGMKAAQILKGLDVANKIEPITDTELLVNQKACRAQGLSVPQSVLDKATTVLQ
jgi:putative tryptophan/tyrosine transport system substrate-binding protein